MHHRTTLAGTALLAAALVLTGCGSGAEEATAAAPSSSSAIHGSTPSASPP